MAEFKVQLKCMWNSETGEFENLAGEEDNMQEDDDDDDDDAEWNFCTERSLYTSFFVILSCASIQQQKNIYFIHHRAWQCWSLCSLLIYETQTSVLHSEF